MKKYEILFKHLNAENLIASNFNIIILAKYCISSFLLVFYYE